MPQYQLLRCLVALGGDDGTTVYRDRHRPIMFPELIVLQHIHGEDAVTDVHVVGTCEMAADETMIRLLTIYGEETVKEVFPGARPQLPRADGTIPICTLPIYVPKPTRPDSPDPKLRPLDQFTLNNAERIFSDQPVEDEPTDAEIAAHAQHDDAEPDPAQIDALADELGLGVASKPTGAVLAQGRTNYVGNTSGDRAANLPDVARSPDRTRNRADRAARG
jgi:hypothetical protein